MIYCEKVALNKKGEMMKNKKWDNKLLHSIVINTILLLLLFLFFSPTNRIDDYQMETTLYGRYTGQYCAYMQYSNNILAQIIVLLLKCNHNVPWYAVLQMLSIFISFVCITWLLFEKIQANLEYIGFSILLFLVGWDFYIYYTFTKTAGILIIAGMLLLFNAIINEKKNVFSGLVGAILILWGNLFRPVVFFMIVLLFLGGFFFWVLKRDREKKVGRIIILASVLLVLLAGWKIEGICGKNLSDSIAEWDQYAKNQAVWGKLYDYAWPEYETNKEVYTSLGISENDYIMIKKYANRTDNTWLDNSKMEKIREMFNQSMYEDVSLKDKIEQGIKNIRLYWLADPTFFFWLITLCLLIVNEKKSLIRVFVLNIFLFVIYLYLWCYGRVMIHTDAVIFATTGCLNLYFLPEEKKVGEKKKVLWCCLIVLSMFVMVFYDKLSISPYSYISKRDANTYNQKLKLLSDDESHIYIFGGANLNGLFFQGLTGLKKPDSGYLHNIYSLAESSVPTENTALEKYDVVNPMKEMLDSDKILFVCTEEYLEQMPCVLTYLQEHYNQNAKMYLVKKIDIFYIYSFSTQELILEDEEMEDAKEWSIDYKVDSDGKTNTVTGTAYRRGVDSYLQQVFIKTRNVETNEESYYYTMQKISEQHHNDTKMNGKYAGFNVSFGLDEVLEEIIVSDGEKRYKCVLTE